MLYLLSGFFFFFFSLVFMLLSFLMMIFKKTFFLEWFVFDMNSFCIHMFIYLDWMGLIFMSVVLLISSMIMFYSNEYMASDKNMNRFFYLVFLFVLSMLVLISSPNLISILIGWDGLGLISYCLVIYYQGYSSFNSGMLTVLMNRVGDVLILISISLMSILGSWNFLVLNSFSDLLGVIFLVLASFTKSAQFPFSSWLPAAMAAPTPVSSLVHSSTLVTAGVYLLIRFHFLIFKSDMICFFIVMSGLLTMLMAGLSANFEYDLKKIIAYSTLSQLGLMMMILGFKNFDLAYFHLIIHAMFKSMMFMCSGIFIHSMNNYQDIRYMGLVGKFFPLTSLIFIVANFSLCGVPFLSGFYSKDQILDTVLMSSFSLFMHMFMLIGTGFTVSYSVRLSCYLMGSYFNMFPMLNVSEVKSMAYPMFILMLFTIMSGYVMNWLIFSMVDEIHLFVFEKLLILLICLIFILVGLFSYFVHFSFKYFYSFKYFGGMMWFLNKFNQMIVKVVLNGGLNLIYITDKGFSEWGFNKSIKNFSYYLSVGLIKLNINYVSNLLLLISYMVLVVLLVMY